MISKNKILDVGITNESEGKILEYLLQKLKNPEKFYIVTPNPEIIVYANKHEQYKKILNSAEIALADGAGLFLASIIMAKPLKQRIPGVDFVEEICKRSVRNPISIGFLGGRSGVAQRTADCLKSKYPWLKIVFIAEEWSAAGFLLGNENQESGIRNHGTRPDNKGQAKQNPNSLFLIHNSPKIDILFVAFGHPRQEEWIYNNLKKIPVKAAMGVGGAFDYISGEAHRAPFMVRAIGFEWLYRLIRQPWRWRRQLALIEFIRLVFKERFGKI